MEEQEFKQTYHELNQRPCVFEKTILLNCGACGQAQKVYLAEREGVGCHSPNDYARCSALSEALQYNARFVLRLAHSTPELPHAKAVKVQCGGLLGLQHALAPDANAEYIADICRLIQQALSAYGSLEQFPYQEAVRFMAHFQPRRARRSV